MAPNTDSEVRKAKVGINVKRLFSKLLSSKTKIVSDKVKNDDHLVFDALPDKPREGNKISDESLPSMNTDNGVKVNSNQRNCNEKTPSNDTSHGFSTMSDDEEENEDVINREKKNKNDKKKKQQSNTNRSKPFGFKNCPSVVYQTNMTITGGTGIHIGDNKTSVSNIYYNATPAKQMNETSPRDSSPAINALMKSQVKLESAHLNVLSEHFGTNWKKIGLTLGFTAGELDGIREKYESQSCQEKGFQMLHVWCCKTGKKAKVGVLCRKLWYGGIDSAMDAVEQLSLKIDDI